MDAKSIIVLLVEDNEDDALLIRKSLAGAMKVPYELKHVDGLSLGMESLAGGKIDVVLLDLGLPDGRGISTFTVLHKHSPDVPVIVLTGHDDEELAIEAVQKGAQDYLVKGKVDGGLLRRSIRYAIERQKLSTQLKQSMKEINTLRGFLPICANCKKIRDDQGYWTQIETYISMHSEAEFSHGLCPECVVKLYGDEIGKKI
jgi:DNA-binding NtrC family response regulator